MAFVALLLMLPMAVFGSQICDLKCTSHIEGQVGHMSVLNCTIQGDREMIIRVIWKNGKGDLIASYHNGADGMKVEEGYALIEPRWIRDAANVSLIIKNTAMDHRGGYTVLAVLELSELKKTVYLDVTGVEPQESPDSYVQPDEVTETPPNKATNVAAPLVVIGSLTVGLLLILVYYKRRAANRREPVDTDEPLEESV